MNRATAATLAAMALLAVAVGPLGPGSLPASATPDDTASFAAEEGVGVTHHFSFSVRSLPEALSMERAGDGYVADAPVAVAVEAGDRPLAVRFRLVTGNGTYAADATVPAGESRTVRERVRGPGPPDAPEGTLIVRVVQGNQSHLLAREEVALEGER